MRIIMFILEKLLKIVIEKNNEFYEVCSKRIYFTKANKNDRFPSDLSYDGEHPINFYIMHNCVNARIFIDGKRVFSVLNISRFRFIVFVLLNKLFLKFNKIYLFGLTDEQKNRLAHMHKMDSDYPPHINIVDEYDTVKRYYNTNIDYFPEKKYLDKFLDKNNIRHISSVPPV